LKTVLLKLNLLDPLRMMQIFSPKMLNVCETHEEFFG
jgi:hypothetical protein